MKSLSPEEAIAILSDMKIDIPVPKAAVTQIKRNIALDMAISALSCSEIPNSSDTINRQAAIDALDKRFDNVPMELTTEILQLRRDLRELPPAQPEQEILLWLLAYHTKSFELHGRYLPHEVISWLVNDFANVYMAERREE